MKASTLALCSAAVLLAFVAGLVGAASASDGLGEWIGVALAAFLTLPPHLVLAAVTADKIQRNGGASYHRPRANRIHALLFAGAVLWIVASGVGYLAAGGAL